MKRTFQQDLEDAVAYHGHLCAGQIIGTRASRLGLEHFGIEDAREYRDLIAFVEADRCIADAVSTVAHCHIGRRRLKWHDMGKMAVTFYDIQTQKALRICAINESRPESDVSHDKLITFYTDISDADFFKVEEVIVQIDRFDLPGKPLRRVECEVCGERVVDGREVEVNGKILCKYCAGIDTYYKVISTGQITTDKDSPR